MIGVVFGGKSVEHDISIITGLQTISVLKKNYDVFPIYIDRENKWWTGKNLEEISIYKDFQKFAKKKRRVIGAFGEGLFVNNKKMDVSCVFVCMHGAYGEDGTISALLEELNLPYTSSDSLTSAITMDKVVTKDILSVKGIPNLAYYNLQNIERNKMDFPVIVKPAKLGSSIGIGVARDAKEFEEKLKLAFEFDDKVLVEEYLDGAREFNCACFMYNGKLYVSKCAEVIKNEMFSFEEKYIKESKNVTEIEKDIIYQIENMTKSVYQVLNCFGIVRVDYLYKDEKLYVNEINSIPGALAIYLFNQRADEIFDLLIEESIERFNIKNKKNYMYESDILSIFENSSLMIKCKK